MAETRKKRPRDPIALAKLIGDIATGQVKDRVEDNRNPAAVALGKLGGAKGGRARAEKLSKKRKIEIAKKAANKRWLRKLTPGRVVELLQNLQQQLAAYQAAQSH
jgi:hypothetical protein